MTKRRRAALFAAAALIVLSVIAATYFALQARRLTLDANAFRVTGGGADPLTEQQALLLGPGRVCEAIGLARYPAPYRARLRIEMSHFNDFEIGVAGPGGEASLVFDRDHYPNRFVFGQVSSFEIVATGRQIAFVLDGTVNQRVDWAGGAVDRLFVAARQSQLRLLDVELRAGEDGRGPVLLRGPLIAHSAGALAVIGISLAALGATALLLLLELGLGRLLRVERGRVLASWLAVTAPVAVCTCLAARYQWIGSYLAPIPLLWFFFRVRFWLTAANTFGDKRNAWWRVVATGGGVVATGTVFAFAVLRQTTLGWAWAAAAGVVSLALLALAGRLLARDLKLSPRGAAAVAGPAFLPLIVVALIAVLPGGRSGLAIWLPIALLTLSFPVSAHRATLRRHGVLMLIVVLLALAGLELGLRFADVAARLRPLNIGKTYDPDRDLFWVPKGLFGDSGNWVQREDLHVRRLAFRGHEQEPLVKPPGTTRLMVFGGSNVWGDGQPTNGTTFCGLLETGLRARGYRAEVLNAGVKGYNSFQVMVLLTKYALAYRPDVVVIYLARNDLAQDLGLFTYRELWNHAQSGSYRALTTVQAQLRRSLLYNGLSRLLVNWRQRLRGQWYDPGVWKPVDPPPDFRQNVADMVDAARHAGARVVLATEFWGEPFLTSGGTANARLVELLQAIRDVAREKNVPLLDVWRYFAATDDPLRWVLRDDPVHFNAAGHAEMARLLEQFLVQNALLP